MYVCSHIYRACKAHAAYYIAICGLYGCNSFPHHLINDSIFEKSLLIIQYVCRFYLKLLPEIFLVLRRTQRDMIGNVDRSSCIVPVILV